MFEFFKKKRKSMLINGNLTVTLTNRSQLIFLDSTKEMFEFTNDPDRSDEEVVAYYYAILEAKNVAKELRKHADDNPKKTIKDVISVKEEQKIAREETATGLMQEANLVKEVDNPNGLLVKSGDFNEHDGSMYLLSDGKEIPLSIPVTLLKRFHSLLQEINNNKEDALDEYIALKNFWMWLSLNPVGVNRERLYDFITRNGLKINKHGLFFAYRMILTTNSGKSDIDKDYITFISDNHMKIKKAKKGPNNYIVVKRDSDYLLAKHDSSIMPGDDRIGKLGDLYAVLGEQQEQMFTDNFSKTFDIRIGHEVSQDASLCNFDSSVSYSRGLHNGSVNYGLYNGFGDTPILTLINPMNVCAVPSQDVLRSTAYLPVSIITESTSKDVLKSGSTLDIADEYYVDSTKRLKELIKNNTPQELKEHKIIADISPDAMKFIANQIEDISVVLSKRVIQA